jgi:hypothetical protein
MTTQPEVTAEPLPLKRYTEYRCITPGCGTSSMWTGALAGRQSPSDGYCLVCRKPMTEIVDDGRRWRVSFETVDPFGDGEYHLVTRETSDERSARDQVAGLLSLQVMGDPIRAVRLEVAGTTWTAVDVRVAEAEAGGPS